MNGKLRLIEKVRGYVTREEFSKFYPLDCEYCKFNYGTIGCPHEKYVNHIEHEEIVMDSGLVYLTCGELKRVETGELVG